MSTPRRLLQRLHPELGVFGVVGGICLVTDVVLFNVFVFELGMPAVLAKAVDMVITGVMAYFGHRFVTFRHRTGGGVRREVPAFIAVTLASVVLGLLPLVVVRHLLGVTTFFWLNIANLAGIALGTAARYVTYRSVVWKHLPVDPASGSRAIVVAEPAGARQVGSRGLLEMEHELVGE
jgi:putative flippase GtrA